MARIQTRAFIFWCAGIILMITTGCHPERGIEAALLMADMAAGDQPSLMKRLTPPPTRNPVSYRISGRQHSGDLYLPAGEPRAGVLVIPGAAEKGKDDPRLVAFATTLARGSFTVLVPDLTRTGNLRIGSENVGEVVDAFLQLKKLPGGTPRGVGGICAFSYAVGPAILASLEPEIRDDVCFVTGIGGYYDLASVFTFFTTGWFRDHQGQWRHREPNEYGKWAFVISNLGRLSDRHDRRLFAQMADRKLAGATDRMEDLVVALTPEGKRLYEFLVNTEPSRVPGLIATLPQGVRREMERLNLANKDLSVLKARLILVHGLDDEIIPYTESEALSSAAPPGSTELYLARGLFHVDVKAGLSDRWQLWRSVAALLRARDMQRCR